MIIHSLDSKINSVQSNKYESLVNAGFKFASQKYSAGHFIPNIPADIIDSTN